MQRTITMTEKELERSKTIHMASEKRLMQYKGAKRLNISERHFRGLLRRYREKGDAGLAVWPLNLI
ncbi:MAG: helix-turn-helix domain-containing protein [Anaerolineaceae bacterium]|nr:helix-turn-helix domain-containing protein [Anaerolineaceae bacterium]